LPVPLLNNELHNFLTLLSTVFLVIHILAAWADPFTHFGWNEIFIPFASSYRTLWVAPGIVAFYLGLAIGLSTWLRSLISYKWWRRLHVLTLGIYVLATLHGIGAGSDTQTWWALSMYLASSVLVGTLLWRRQRFMSNKRKLAHSQSPLPTRGAALAPQRSMHPLLIPTPSK